MSIVSWFARSRGVNGFKVLWCQWSYSFTCFVVSWFHRFHGVNGPIVSRVSWFRGVSGFMVL